MALQRTCVGFALLCAACGSGGEDGGSMPPASGSLVLEVKSTQPSKEGFDYAVRVDLGAGEHAGEAVATPAFGQSGLYTVVGTSSSTLTAVDSMASGQLRVGNHLDRWYEISLDGSGFSAKVERQITDGDAISHESISVTGSAKSDATPPAFQVTTDFSGGDAGTALPWSELAVFSSEGVVEASLLGAVGIADDKGAPLAASWQSEAVGSSLAWAGARRARGRVTGFDAFETTRKIVVSLTAGVADLAGNAAQATATELTVLGVGTTKPALELAAGLGDAGSWGVVGPAVSAAESCPTEGCVLVGPTACAKSSGLAARLVTSGKSKIHVRARVLTDSPTYTATGFVIDVAVPGSAPSEQPIQATGFVPLSTPVGKATHHSDWLDINADIPAGAEEVGVAVRAQTKSCGYFAPQIENALVIDVIEAL